MTLNHLKNSFLGRALIEAEKSQAARIIDICIKNELNYEKCVFSENSVKLDLSLNKGERLSRILKESGIPHSIIKKGLPVFLSGYKCRFGLMLGFILILSLLLLSGRYVWDIRIEGCNKLSREDILSQLATAGFGIGSKIGERDVDEIANEVLLSSENISWISINYNGSVAYVKIREKEKAFEHEEDITAPSNVIAERDGIIEYYQVLRGKEEISEGQSVRKGELLISGIIESTHGETRYDHAMGSVYAITNRSFSIRIPLEYEKKVLKKPLCTKKTVKFFSKYINIFKKGGNLGSTCVKIIEEDPISIFGLPPLPFGIVSELTSEYSVAKERRSEKEASELAFFELENIIFSELSDAQLLRKNITTEISESEFILNCEILCVEDIAISAPIGKEIKY